MLRVLQQPSNIGHGRRNIERVSSRLLGKGEATCVPTLSHTWEGHCHLLNPFPKRWKGIAACSTHISKRWKGIAACFFHARSEQDEGTYEECFALDRPYTNQSRREAMSRGKQTLQKGAPRLVIRFVDNTPGKKTTKSRQAYNNKKLQPAGKHRHVMIRTKQRQTQRHYC